MTPPSLHAARASDAPAIAALLGELGYPASAGQVRERLGRLATFGRATVRVAELEGEVVGVVTAHHFPSIHDDADVAWLTTLVVAEGARGSGVGRALVADAEAWAREHGCVRISVTSGAHRAGAHAFYEAIGYERTGVRLTKRLG